MEELPLSSYFLPSWKELNTSLLTAILVILLYILLNFANEELKSKTSPRRSHDYVPISSSTSTSQNLSPTENTTHPEMIQFRRAQSLMEELGSGYAESQPPGCIFLIKMELIAASNLPASSMSGTADPYAVITCGEQRRFSSVVPGSRNPMWGECFDFISPELPAMITISIYDWDIIWKSQELGSTTIAVNGSTSPEVSWIPLNGIAGQVCVQIQAFAIPTKDVGSGSAGSPVNVNINRIRRFSRINLPEMEQEGVQVATEVRQKPGPLQTIFGLPPDEVVLHTYSCALERSFLYHGRMYVSLWHICFHSNLFGKNMTLTLPLTDIEQMRKSFHAYINPAITIVLKSGSGGHGVPPLAGPDGRAKYKFASFWNRGHVYRTLQRSLQKCLEQEDLLLQEEESALLRSQSTLGDNEELKEVIQRHLASTGEHSKFEEAKVSFVPFLQEDILSVLLEADIPCSPMEYFDFLYSEQSKFTEHYRGVRKDTELKIEPWHHSDTYEGKVRKITFRSLCNSPMCPPTTAMTEWQHCASSADNEAMTLEFIQEAHDVPFGSYFEVQARWSVTSAGIGCSRVKLLMGVHFKKWCVMQGKIRHGAANEYKSDANRILDLAHDYILKNHRTNDK